MITTETIEQAADLARERAYLIALRREVLAGRGVGAMVHKGNAAPHQYDIAKEWPDLMPPLIEGVSAGLSEKIEAIEVELRGLGVSVEAVVAMIPQK